VAQSIPFANGVLPRKFGTIVFDENGEMKPPVNAVRAAALPNTRLGSDASNNRLEKGEFMPASKDNGGRDMEDKLVNALND